MPYYTNSIHNCRSIRVGALEGCKSQPLGGYESNGTQASVYSAQCVIPLVRDVGHCPGCNSDGKELVNGYCATCRTMGANERECLNPRLIERRQATGRKNSENSMWRKSRL